MDDDKVGEAFESILVSINQAADEAEILNAEGKPTRSRELSLAITKLDEARHWLTDARDLGE